MTDLIPQRMALPIDIDNGSASAIGGVLRELERYGSSNIRFGCVDFEHTGAAWREACISCAIEAASAAGSASRVSIVNWCNMHPTLISASTESGRRSNSSRPADE